MTFKLNNKVIKNFSPSYIIAEVGANFNGDLDIAKKMILEVKKSGADAVKFQAGNKDNMLSQRLWKDKESPLPIFGHKTQAELEDFLSLSYEDHENLFEFSKKNNIDFSSTVFSNDYVEFLSDLDVPYFKIASMDLNHHDLIERVSLKKKPTFLSTGLGTFEEIKEAVNIFKKNKNDKLVIFHCVSLYPPSPEEINLNNINFLRKELDIVTGFSDHSVGTEITLAALALGSAAIEKHFTLDKKMPGWDHGISADPDDLKFICESAIKINQALGHFERNLSIREKKNTINFRRSIVAKKNLKKGQLIEKGLIDFKRPGDGIPPKDYKKIIGKKLNKNINYDELILFENIE